MQIEIPSIGDVERLILTFQQNPLGAVLFILVLIVAVAGIHAWRSSTPKPTRSGTRPKPKILELPK